MTEMTLDGQDVKTFGNPPVPVVDVVDDEGNTYCQIHTDRETGLRCNNCTRLMCAKCAVQTPVGYRCEQCVRERERNFFNADAGYYTRLFAASAVGSAIGAVIASFIGFFLFVFFIAAAAGGMIGELALRVTKGKRGRYAAQVAAGGVIAGVVLMAMGFAFISTNRLMGVPEQQLIAVFGTAQPVSIFLSSVFARLTSLSMLIYAGITAFTVYGRFNIYRR